MQHAVCRCSWHAALRAESGVSSGGEVLLQGDVCACRSSAGGYPAGLQGCACACTSWGGGCPAGLQGDACTCTEATLQLSSFEFMVAGGRQIRNVFVICMRWR